MTNQNGLAGLQLQYEPERFQMEKTSGGLTNALRQAQIDQMSQENKYTPLKYLMEAANSQRQSDRFGQAYQLSKTLMAMPAATRNQWIADNQEAYNDMLNIMGNQNNQMPSAVSALNNEIGRLFLSGQPQKLPQTPSQMAALKNENKNNPAINGELVIQEDKMPQNKHGFASSPEQIDRMRNASQMSANNSLVTAATRRQQEGATQVVGIMNDPEFQAKAISASQYAGALGKGKAAVAALSQQNPKAYEDYLSFTNHDFVLLENRIKTLDQMGATDAQREQLSGMFNKTMTSLTSNPAQFMTQLNNLRGALDTVARAVAKFAQPLGADGRSAQYNLLQQGSKMDFASRSNEDLMRIANGG